MQRNLVPIIADILLQFRQLLQDMRGELSTPRHQCVQGKPQSELFGQAQTRTARRYNGEIERVPVGVDRNPAKSIQARIERTKKIASQAQFMGTPTRVRVGDERAAMWTRDGEKRACCFRSVQNLEIIAGHNRTHAKTDQRDRRVRLHRIMDIYAELLRQIRNSEPAIPRSKCRCVTGVARLCQPVRQRTKNPARIPKSMNHHYFHEINIGK